MLAATVVAAGLLTAPIAKADVVDVFDCTADMGDPEEGSLAWDLADQNNRWCVTEGSRTAASNPAWYAASAANAAQASAGAVDPFRALVRWAGVRGSHETVTWTDREGLTHAGALFGPLDADGGPYTGVVIPCHTCIIPSAGSEVYYWLLEILAEHGYVVFFPDIGGNNVPATVDATDWFMSTEASPSPHELTEFNPWWARLDHSAPLGIAGHSGSGGVSLNVGNMDDRYGAIVAFDPAGPKLDGLDLQTPAMIQVADYRGAVEDRLKPRHTKPVPAAGSKFTYFDTIRAAGGDTMQISLRGSAHGEWSGAIHPGQMAGQGSSLYGEAMAAYYTLTWFDRYLRGSTDARDRLTATSEFDTFADQYQIGTGFFDVRKAERAQNVEAGNVPITMGGRSIRNRLSWWYPTRYFLDGGALQCEDVRAGCPGPDEWQPGDGRPPGVGRPGSRGSPR